MAIASDLFLGGSETTSKSMMYAVAFLIHNAKVQAKVQEEVSKIDKDVITWTDKDSLPYTEATLHEVWSLGNIAPYGPPRITSGPVNIAGYDFPKGTVVMHSTYSVHMDKKYWGDPEIFRPERFMTEDGKFKPDERTIPFGIGKRRCLGESLARMENFLFLANLMKNFRFSAAEGVMPELRPLAGLTNGPPPFYTKIDGVN